MMTFGMDLFMSSVRVQIVNQLGLHVRVCSKIVTCANKFSAIITIQHNDQIVNAKRIMEIMSLGASYGDTVEISTNGDDAAAALQAMESLFLNGFFEI